MQHRNYVYDCERRYAAAEREGFTDSAVREMHRRFQSAKRDLERNTELRSAAERLLRAGQPGAWAEAERARRACNGNETELSSLAQRISREILRIRNSNRR